MKSKTHTHDTKQHDDYDNRRRWSLPKCVNNQSDHNEYRAHTRVIESEGEIISDGVVNSLGK